MERYLKQHKKECTGCTACVNICSQGAIELQQDKLGFYRAVINNEKCINCGKCEKICPQINFKMKNEENICYAGWADDTIRKKSSSGGIFTMLALEILDQSGIICGASFNKEQEVVHICIDKYEDLGLLQKSKYVQSNLKYVFKEIEQYLKEGRKVLFTGCPCQVAGLYAYLGVDYNNLYTVDLMCKGVPSSKVFKQYLKECTDISNIESVDFRDKDKGWTADWLVLHEKDGNKKEYYTKKDLKSKNYNWYTRNFLDGTIINDACYDCKFAELPRVADITIGDFWGIWNKDISWIDKKGTSLILTNSNRGRELFESIKYKLKRIEQRDVSDALPYNRFNRLLSFNNRKERFKELVDKQTISEALKNVAEEKYDVGIVGTKNVANQGAAILCYALYKFISDLGYTVLMIGQPEDSIWKPRKENIIFENNPYPDYAISKTYSRKREMKDLNRKCEMFVLSSDQLLFNHFYKMYGECFALDWTYENKKRIAYGASFTLDHAIGTDWDIAEMARNLQRFDYFSVREKSGIELAANTFGVNATWVVDPVFLCDESVYEEFAEVGKKYVPNEKYVASCIWHASKEKYNALKEYAELEEVRLINIVETGIKADNDFIPKEICTEYGTNVEQWLAFIKNSDAIITDSFHSVCMSIIFRKRFVVMATDAPTRIYSLLNMLGLADRIIEKCSIDEILKVNEEIDYDTVYSILEEKVTESKQWLKNALESNVEKKALSEYDVLDLRCDNIMRVLNEKRIPELEEKINNRITQERAELSRDIENIPVLKEEIKEIKQSIRDIELLMFKLAKIFNKFGEE